MGGWEIATNILTAVAAMAGGGGLFVAIANRRKMNSDIQSQDSRTAVNYSRLANDWIIRLEEKVHALEEEITELKHTITQYEKRIIRLLNHVKDVDDGD